eukprot:363596-Chlamydomonas_euryale.AAC.2
MNTTEGRRVRKECRSIQDAAAKKKNTSEEAAAVPATVAGDACHVTSSNHFSLGNVEAAIQATQGPMQYHAALCSHMRMRAPNAAACNCMQLRAAPCMAIQTMLRYGLTCIGVSKIVLCFKLSIAIPIDQFRAVWSEL